MDRAVSFFQSAAHGNLGALGHRIIEKFLDAAEVLIIDDLGDTFLLDAPVVRGTGFASPWLETPRPSASFCCSLMNT